MQSLPDDVYLRSYSTYNLIRIITRPASGPLTN